MDDSELRGLLGPAYDDTDADQRQQVSEAAERIDARWHPDLVDERQEAMTGALLVILGDDTPAALVGQWRAARDAEAAARARMTGALIVQAGTGASESGLAAEHGLARDTVRKALGKGR